MLTQQEYGWKLFEAYTRKLMADGRHTFECRACVDKSNLAYNTNIERGLGGCVSIRCSAFDIVQAAGQNRNVVFHSVDRRKQKLIDFIYCDANSHFHAFQVTIGKTHTANIDHIKQLQQKAGGGNQLSLYYLVPSQNFSQFVTTPVEPQLDNDISCEILHVYVPDPNES
jgi:hypothetical protein